MFATFKFQSCPRLQLSQSIYSSRIFRDVFFFTFFSEATSNSSFSTVCLPLLQTKTPHQRGARFWTWALNTSMAQLHPMNNEMRSSTVSWRLQRLWWTKLCLEMCYAEAMIQISLPKKEVHPRQECYKIKWNQRWSQKQSSLTSVRSVQLFYAMLSKSLEHLLGFLVPKPIYLTIWALIWSKLILAQAKACDI